MLKIGFIGCGNMAGAMIGGILRKKLVAPDQIIATAKTRNSIERAKKEYSIGVTLDNREAASFADVLVLAVKPVYMEEVLDEIADALKPDSIVVSLAPGKTLEWFAKKLGPDRKIVRTMPNTPALVGEGMTAICPNRNLSEEDIQLVENIFQSFGKTEITAESMIDVVTGISGSSPAYVFLFIEAMADAAVLKGMPRKQAYVFASQAVLGSAKMVLETGKHPGELKDMVCSPAGTTIEAVKVLEEKGFRGAVMDAVSACVDKGRGM